MARIAIDAAIGSGFGLIRRRPGSVLVWGLVYLAIIVLNFALFGSFYAAIVAQVAASATLGADASSQALTAMMPQMMAMQGWSLLLSVVAMLVNSIVYCAVFRAVLHRDQNRFGYMRVGVPEFMLFVLIIGAYIIFVVAAVLAILVVALLVFALGAMHAAAAGAILAVLAGVAGVAVVIWIILRFSMVGPMMVSDGKFHLFESWALTKGHAGVLLVIAICLVVIALVVEVVAVAVLFMTGAAMFHSVGGMASITSLLNQPPAAIAASLAPFLIVGAAVTPVVAGCMFAIWGAPWARAYLDLTQPEPVAAAA